MAPVHRFLGLFSISDDISDSVESVEGEQNQKVPCGPPCSTPVLSSLSIRRSVTITVLLGFSW